MASLTFNLPSHSEHCRSLLWHIAPKLVVFQHQVVCFIQCPTQIKKTKTKGLSTHWSQGNCGKNRCKFANGKRGTFSCRAQRNSAIERKLLLKFLLWLKHVLLLTLSTAWLSLRSSSLLLKTGGANPPPPTVNDRLTVDKHNITSNKPNKEGITKNIWV